MSCGCNSSNQSPCVPTPTVHLSNCEGCVYTVNTDCVIYNGDRLDFEPSSVVNGSVRNLTDLMELFPSCHFHTDCIYFDGEPFGFEDPSVTGERTLTELLTAITDYIDSQQVAPFSLTYWSETSSNNKSRWNVVSSDTNQSAAIVPKGTGGFTTNPLVALGQYSVDLTNQASTGSAAGATGNYAFAIGENVRATGRHSKVSGWQNEAAGRHSEISGSNGSSIYDYEKAHSYRTSGNSTSDTRTERTLYLMHTGFNATPFAFTNPNGVNSSTIIKPQLNINGGNSDGIWACEVDMALRCTTAGNGYNINDAAYLVKRRFIYSFYNNTCAIVGNVSLVGSDIGTSAFITGPTAMTFTIVADDTNKVLSLVVTPPTDILGYKAAATLRMIQIL